MSPKAPSVRAGLNMGMLFWNRGQNFFSFIFSFNLGWMTFTKWQRNNLMLCFSQLEQHSLCRPNNRWTRGCWSPCPVGGSSWKESIEHPGRKCPHNSSHSGKCVIWFCCFWPAHVWKLIRVYRPSCFAPPASPSRLAWSICQNRGSCCQTSECSHSCRHSVTHGRFNFKSNWRWKKIFKNF